MIPSHSPLVSPVAPPMVCGDISTREGPGPFSHGALPLPLPPLSHVFVTFKFLWTSPPSSTGLLLISMWHHSSSFSNIHFKEIVYVLIFLFNNCPLNFFMSSGKPLFSYVNAHLPPGLHSLFPLTIVHCHTSEVKLQT